MSDSKTLHLSYDQSLNKPTTPVILIKESADEQIPSARRVKLRMAEDSMNEMEMR
jgi:hypothetical protein